MAKLDLDSLAVGIPQNAGDRKSMFEKALEALPDGVLLTNASRRVLYANRAFATHWGIPPELLASDDESSMLKFVTDQLADPEEFQREVERLHPTDESSQDEVRFKDGRIFSRRSVPFQKEGEFQARIWIFTDVTEAHNASIDALTGIKNRHAYSRDFPSYVRAEDDGFVRSVAIMDVDNFKKYNDRYGHEAGDAVLRQIGHILQSHLHNADDLLFRVGGEEFLMAVRSRNEIDALALFETVRCSIAAMETVHEGNSPHGVVTASIGLASFHDGKDPAEVFRRVDAAMYEAKKKGRNAIVPLSF